MLSDPLPTDGNRCAIGRGWGGEIRCHCQRYRPPGSRSRVKGKSIDQLGIDSLKGLLQVRDGSIQRGISVLDLERVRWRAADYGRGARVRSLPSESPKKNGADEQDSEQEDGCNEGRTPRDPIKRSQD